MMSQFFFEKTFFMREKIFSDFLEVLSNTIIRISPSPIKRANAKKKSKNFLCGKFT